MRDCRTLFLIDDHAYNHYNGIIEAPVTLSRGYFLPPFAKPYGGPAAFLLPLGKRRDCSADITENPARSTHPHENIGPVMPHVRMTAGGIGRVPGRWKRRHMINEERIFKKEFFHSSLRLWEDAFPARKNRCRWKVSVWTFSNTSANLWKSGDGVNIN